MKKEREDSPFWKVDRALAELLVKVAAGHAKEGGEAVVLTGRKPPGAGGAALLLWRQSGEHEG